MSNINLPPFYIGQKVVALATSGNIDGNQVFKNNIYTVAGCYYCSCGKWQVTLKELSKRTTGTKYNLCHISPSPDIYAGGEARYFAPIESQFVTITFKECIAIESPVTCMQ